MTNGNSNAYPQIETSVDFNRTTDKHESRVHSMGGLTKREYFAAMAMQGIATKKGSQVFADMPGFGRDAVRLADALIDALNKEADHATA
jgi:hypothetical protein